MTFKDQDYADKVKQNLVIPCSPGGVHHLLYISWVSLGLLSYSPWEVLVISLPDAQTASHILAPHEELASIWNSMLTEHQHSLATVCSKLNLKECITQELYFWSTCLTLSCSEHPTTSNECPKSFNRREKRFHKLQLFPLACNSKGMKMFVSNSQSVRLQFSHASISGANE